MLIETTGKRGKEFEKNGSTTIKNQVIREKKVKRGTSTNKKGTKVKPGARSTTKKRRASECMLKENGETIQEAVHGG